MEHGHSATELSSEKRVWARPAVQYLESVFMRGTTTANSITALCFMFICFAPYCSNFSWCSSLMLQNKKISAKIFTLRPDQSFINQPSAERGCMSRLPLQGCNIKTNNQDNYTSIFLRWVCVNRPRLQFWEADLLAGSGWGCCWMAVGKQSHFWERLGEEKPLMAQRGGERAPSDRHEDVIWA